MTSKPSLKPRGARKPETVRRELVVYVRSAMRNLVFGDLMAMARVQNRLETMSALLSELRRSLPYRRKGAR